MGILSDLYNITFDVKRKSNQSGRTDTETTVSSANDGLFYPVTDTTQLFNISSWGKEYRLVCATSVDIKVSDIVVIDSVRYGVEAMTDHLDREDGKETHQEVVINKKKTNS